MELLNLFEIIFWSMLLVLVVYHMYKREYKSSGACALVFGLSFLPLLLRTVWAIRVDAFSILVYDIVLLMALCLGSSMGYYDKYKWWDRVIHFLSGIAGVGVGIAVANLHPGIATWGVMLFGFTFSLTLHVFWEVLEYLGDCMLHGNAQRWQKVHDSVNHVPENAIQPAGLVDTMNDMICCLIGAALIIVVWCFVL